jgi:hypothetical protein
MITRLYEALTGRPWTTTRSMTAEYGPPAGARYATDLAGYSDAELIANGQRILAALRAQEATGTAPVTPPVAGAVLRVRKLRPAAALWRWWPPPVTAPQTATPLPTLGPCGTASVA